MQGVSTWLTSDARPVAALLTSGLGTWAGVRPTLIGDVVLLIVPLVVLACSPLRALRQMPDPLADTTDYNEPAEGIRRSVQRSPHPRALPRRGAGTLR